MKRILDFLKEKPVANIVLLVLVLLIIFVVPLLEVSNDGALYNLLLTGIFVSGVFAYQKNRKVLILFAISLIVIHWIAMMLDLDSLEIIAKSFRSLFFITMVILFTHQVATSKIVSAGTIIEAINSYLLIGLVFIFLNTLVYRYDPSSLAFPGGEVPLGDLIYYTFVTMTTLGYGDVLPTIPLTKSLAILSAVTGQIYIAVIIAMLVGKYASRQTQD